MFLRRRSTQAEYTDTPELPAEVVAANHRELGRVNRRLRFADPFERLLPRWLGVERCRDLSLLDLGAGDGSLGRRLEKTAARRGWRWRVTNLDLNPHALRLAPGDGNVVGCVQALPFADESFDLVIASQMTHHLGGAEEVIRHFCEAWRVTRDAVYLCDLHRNVAAYAALWLVLSMMRLSAPMRDDGLLSVARGWRRDEWRHLAKEAGLTGCRVRLYYGSKIILQARKADDPTPPARTSG